MVGVARGDTPGRNMFDVGCNAVQVSELDSLLINFH